MGTAIVKINKTTKKKIKKTYVRLFENKFGNDLESSWSSAMVILCYNRQPPGAMVILCYNRQPPDQPDRPMFCNVITIHNQVQLLQCYNTAY
jgi:hypothetical protein